MFNHSFDDNTKYSETHDGFVFTAIKDIKRGEQILIDYGQNKLQSQFLDSYGFTILGAKSSYPVNLLRTFDKAKPLDKLILKIFGGKPTSRVARFKANLTDEFDADDVQQMLSYVRIQGFE